MRKHKWLLPLCILAVATLVIGIAFFRGVHSADGGWLGLDQREILSLGDGWELADGTAAEPLPTALTLSADGSVTMTRTLPQELPDGRELYLQTNYQQTQAWLDGEALAVRGISDGLRERVQGDLPWVELTLPQDCAGRRLTLRLSGTGSKPQTELFCVVMGRETDIELLLFRGALMPMLLCMLMLLLAFTLFCFALGEWRRYKEYNFGGVLLITLFVECACVWFFTDSTIQGMAFIGSDAFLLFNIFSYLLFPLPFVLYMRGCLKRGRRVLDTLSVALCAHAVMECLLLVFGGFDLARAIGMSHMLLACAIAALCVFTWRDQRARSQKRPTELLVGLLILAVSGLMAMYSYYFLHDPDNSMFFRYGTFLYLVMLTVNAMRTDVDFVSKARSYEQLRIHEEEYRIAVKQSDKYVMRYDIQSRVCHRQSDAAALFGVEQDLANEPEQFIRRGFVFDESVEDYTAFFAAMRSGVPSGSVTVRLKKKDGGGAWYRGDYTSIFSRSGQPLQSIISFCDVTELREKEIAYEKWKQSYQTMPSRTMNYYEYDLTRNLFDREEGGLLRGVPPEVPRTLSDVAEYLTGRCVYEADREKFRAFFSRDRLLDSYRKGTRSEQLDMRRVDAQGRALWTAASVQLIADPYSNDVKCFLLLRDVDREKREELRQRARSDTDPLTGLLNRSALIEQLTALFEESRVGETHALMMLDVDGFKRVNDTFGHQFGDGVLVGIAGDLRAMMRADDFLSRLGGDEYVVCLRDVPTASRFLEKRARLICQTLSKQFGSDVAISGSLGIALYPQDGTDFDTLYRKADKALYYAKQHGRNLYVFYNEEDMGEGACETESKPPEAAAPCACACVKPQTLRTLLVVDDMEINRELLAEIFRTEYHILMAENGEKALELLQRSDSQISAVLLDLLMPGMGGLRVLEKMRADAYLSTIPVVVVSSMSEQEGGLKAIELGASDFVSKPFDPRLVRLRVTGAIQKRENEELRAQNRYLLVQKSDESRHQNQLRYLAEHDALTNICNKTAFYRKTKQLLEKQPDVAFAMIAFDIGHFRVINDIFGHEEGDRLLRYIASRLQSGLSGRATYGRIDADDFTICLPADDENLQNLFADADAALAEYDLPFDVVLQWGVYYIDDPGLPVSLMHDRAALAKRTVKGNYLRRVAYYDDALREELLVEQEITGEMNAALEQGQFEVYLQPKCCLADGHVIGAEALARWNHPTKGFLSPAKFIPIFEKNGFIMKLDAYIWERACQLLSRWRHLPVRISANLSRVDLYNPNLCKILTGLTDKYEIPRGSLELEITESTYSENAQLMMDVIGELKRQGFVVEMDDFGSGYSSLNMLKEIPVDVLKIDMRFLAGDDRTGRGDSILDSVVNMAHRLGLPVVAEGVETREQVDFLSSLRCDSAQGYYYYKPMPVHEFEALLGRVEQPH